MALTSKDDLWEHIQSMGKTPKPKVTTDAVPSIGRHCTFDLQQSSDIAEVRFYNDTLIITFRKTNARYRYLGVPESVYEELITADSKGKYFLKNVRDHYPCEKLKDDA